MGKIVIGNVVLSDSGADIDLSNLSQVGEAHFANPDLSNLSTAGNNKLGEYVKKAGTNTISANNTFSGTNSFGANTTGVTPAVSDNSAKYITSAWFNAKVQVVQSLPDNPDANTFYFVTG